jgi:hypothetical protein
MRSGIRPSWHRRARAAAAIAAIVWAGPWRPAGADGQTPDGGAGPPGVNLALPFPKAPPLDHGDYLLTPVRGGGYMYDEHRFTARIAPDGHVTFRDKPFRLEVRVLGVLSEKYRRAGDGRPSLVQAIEQVLRGDPDRPISPMVEVCEHPVDMMLPGVAPCIATKTLIRVRGSFRFVDDLLFMTGSGWVRYDKAKFLSATFDFRMALAVQHRAKMLREALADLPDRLDGVWRDPGFAPREKRRIICLLWEEVDVGRDDTRKAADVITGWVRRKLPAGSSDAYSASELEACSASGRRPFAPYDHE